MPEWWNRQTQRTQNPPIARSWGFNSLLGHHLFGKTYPPLCDSLFAFSGEPIIPRCSTRSGGLIRLQFPLDCLQRKREISTSSLVLSYEPDSSGERDTAPAGKGSEIGSVHVIYDCDRIIVIRQIDCGATDSPVAFVKPKALFQSDI
jgi:hypothetical protein